MEVIASAPGKVLIAGGYLILERPNAGLVLSTNARFYAIVKPIYEDVKPESWAWAWADVKLTSPQLSRETMYKIDARNPFVEQAVQYAVAAAHEKLGKDKKDSLDKLLVKGLDITILGSNDFYSYRSELAARGLPLTTEALAALPTFSSISFNDANDDNCKPEVAKTGLGSSAAMTSAVVAALLHYLGTVNLLASTRNPCDESSGNKDLDMVHIIAQTSHCIAQGKVGSGFDVSSAVYGSQHYVRFSPDVISSAQVAANGKSLLEVIPDVLNGNWDHARTKFALPPLMTLLLGEPGTGGSSTPSMVGAVKKWQKNEPEKSHFVWNKLSEANSSLEEQLCTLSKLAEESWEVYKSVITVCSMNSAEKWTTHANSSDEQAIVSALIGARKAMLEIRSLMRQMGDAAGIPIEPNSQTQLLDTTMAMEGVLLAGVPGAGGFDAVFAVTLGDSGDKVTKEWSSHDVLALLVREDPEGVRLENGDPRLKEITSAGSIGEVTSSSVIFPGTRFSLYSSDIASSSAIADRRAATNSHVAIMAANDELLEEWDADFLEAVLQSEDRYLSSANSTQLPEPQPPPRTATAAAVLIAQPQPLPWANVAYNSAALCASSNVRDISYSPPRELSQRPSDSNVQFAVPRNAQEIEIERLKRELERVSNQVNGLEHECMELKRERDKKDKHLKSVLSKNDAKTPEDNCTRTEILNRSGVSECQGANTNSEDAGQMKSKGCQAIAIQTDHDGDLPNFNDKQEPNTDSYLQEKLQTIWSSSSGHRSRSFITKLLVTCTSDFCDLFSYFGLKTSTRTIDSLEREVSNLLASGSYINSFHSAAESTRISNLCSVLYKIKDGMIQVDAFFSILLDLCSTEDALVIHKSLCILRKALAILSTIQSRHGRRENIKDEGVHAEQNAVDSFNSEKHACGAIYGKSKDSRVSDSEGQWKYSDTLLSELNFVEIFQKMCTISVKSTYKQVQSEAVFIMNAILVRTNGFSEREEYGVPVVFEAVAHLLRKEADLSLQREAVRLLHLLLNCPKLLAKFCLGWNVVEKHPEATDRVTSAESQVSHTILQGLADCIGRFGNDAQDISLRRNATVVLAFMASSGTSGFEIVLSHKLSNGVNFLGLILLVVASDLDAEASDSEHNLDILKERTLFMREALILLNRLASNPTTSTAVLQVLTSNRDMVSLSVYVAAKLSRECRQLGTSEWSMNRTRQSEVTELARVFKKRVFSYLGETFSS
ncbi:hypothetical protein V2J09_004792 [Rumex salicifolius]